MQDILTELIVVSFRTDCKSNRSGFHFQVLKKESNSIGYFISKKRRDPLIMSIVSV